MMNYTIAFRDALQADFGSLEWLPIADGTIHRFHAPGDKAGTRNGWYVLHGGDLASGCYGTWKSAGTWHAWSSRQPVDHLEAEMLRQRTEQAKRQREAERHQLNQDTAERANRLWQNSWPADPHNPYLVRKGNKPHNLRQRYDELLVPLFLDDQLVNLQRIVQNGNKRFLYGGITKGAYSPLGVIAAGQRLYVCEGWATGATLHEETGAAVACAMNCNNLMEVGQRLQRRHPDAVLIIAGDDDRQTEGNPGRTAANKTAAALGCELIMPPWSGAEPLTCSDFNDLANWRTAQ